MKEQTYFDSLHQVLAEVSARLEHQVAVLTEPAFFSERAFLSGVNYNETHRECCPVATLKGKPTRKWANVVVYRTEEGRYELTMYLF